MILRTIEIWNKKSDNMCFFSYNIFSIVRTMEISAFEALPPEFCSWRETRVPEAEFRVSTARS